MFIYFFSCFCFFVLFVFFFGGGGVFVLLLSGGFKGQVRWPKGPPHLALNPPYFFFVFVPFFAFNPKSLFLPLKKGILVYFSVSPFVSL